MDPLNVTVTLSKIHCFDETDTVFSPDADPYIWTLFFKLDADAVVSGKPTVQTTPGNHDDLGSSGVSAGEDVPIPAGEGVFTTLLKPLPISAIADESRIGVVVVVLEADDTPNHAIAKGHQAFDKGVKDKLTGFVQKALTGKFPTQADIDAVTPDVMKKVMDAIKNDLSGFELLANQDDLIGKGLVMFKLGDIRKAGAAGLPIQMDFTGEGKWRLTGKVVGSVPLKKMTAVIPGAPLKLDVPVTFQVQAFDGTTHLTDASVRIDNAVVGKAWSSITHTFHVTKTTEFDPELKKKITEVDIPTISVTKPGYQGVVVNAGFKP